MTDATIALKVDSSGLKTGQSEMDKLGQKGKQTEQELNKSSQKMSNGFAGAAKAAVAMTAAYVGFRTVTAAVSSVIRANTEFERSISNLSAITGAVGEDLKFYSDQAKEIGRTTSLSASQASEAFKLIASAKPDLLSSAASLAAVTREAVTLAEATGVELPAAAQALGAALNQFQLPASDANRVINALAASSQLGTAEVGAVTEAMRNAGAAANSLGLDFEETVAGIQALAASGRQGADAGTALRQVLLRLEATADQTLMPSVVGLDAALQELSTRSYDNTELMDLFGQEAFTAAASLLAQKDVVGELNVTLRGTQIATEQARVNMDNLSGDTLAARSATEALQIALGERLNPALRDGVRAYTNTVGKIAEFVSGIGEASEASQILKGILDESSITVDTWGDSVDDAVTYVNALIDGKLDLIAATVANSESITNNAELQERINMLLGEGSRLQARYRMLTDGSAAAEQIRTSVMSAAANTADKNTESVEENAEAVESLTQEYSFLFRMLNRDRNTVETTTHSIEAQETAVFDLINVLSDVPLTYSAIIAKGRETTFVMQGVTAATGNNTKATEFWTAVSEEGAQRRTAAEKAAADAMEENWQRTHEYVTTSILDIADNGGSAFERLGDIAVATAKRIAAEWLALKAMDLFGITVPGGSSGGLNLTPLLGGGGGGSSGILSSLGGFFGGSSGGISGSADWSTGLPTGGGTGGFSIGELNAGNIGQSLVYGAAGSALGNAAGEAMFGKVAESDWGSTVGGAIGAVVGGPVGAAIGSALGSAADVMFGGDGYERSFAGLLTAPTAGAAGKTFDAGTFASGFRATGIAHRATQDQAMQNIDMFRAVDAAITKAVRAAGGNIDLSQATLGGVGMEGQFGTAGTFLGQGGKTTAQDIAQMLESFTGQLLDHVSGLDEELMQAVKSASSAEEAIRLLSEATAEQDQLAEKQLNNFEIAQKSAAESVVSAFESGMNELDSIDRAYKQFQQFADRGLTSEAIANFTGFMASEIDAVLSAGEARAAAIGAQSGPKAPYGGFSLFGAPEERLSLLGLDGSHANGLASVPFDGYRAELHRKEEVLTANDPRNQNNGSMMQAFTVMQRELIRIGEQTKRTSDILLRVTRDGNALLTEAV